MDGRFKHFALAVIVVCAALLACGFPLESETPRAQRTVLAATIFVMQTEVSTLQTPEPSDAPTITPIITDTGTPSPFPTAQNPLVIHNYTLLAWARSLRS